MAMREVVERIGERLASSHLPSGAAPDNGHNHGSQWLPLLPSSAVSIPAVERPRRTAFVDGGNATLVGTPGYSVGFNRVYYALCQGREMLQPKFLPRTDFLTLMDTELEADDSPGAGGLRQQRRYRLRTFPLDAGGKNGANKDGNGRRILGDRLPTREELGEGAASSLATSHNRSRMASVPRAFAEWKTAAAVVREELRSRDMIVMDGTLQTGYGGESALADRLYEDARDKGVVVCALAKTTTLVSASGHPLLCVADDAGRRSGHGRWYMPLAERVSGDDRGFVLAVRLHPRAPFVFRLEILRDQYQAMEAAEIGEVIGSLAANATDPSFLGYPYGLVNADRYAKVRAEEARILRGMLLHEMGLHEMGRTMIEHAESLSAHKHLNRATG